MSPADPRPGLLETTLRQDRAVVVAGLLGVVVLAWAYLVHLTGMMPADAAMAMPAPEPWGAREFGWLAVMWIVMMVAMMLPTAAPTILLFGVVSRRRRARGIPAVPAAVFTLGYLFAWTAYATIGAVVQGGLHAAALLSPAMASASPLLGGGLLVAAGIYQWLPLKAACLAHCQSPLGFFSAHWREGARGALVMGMRHGAYCVGCCWLLMALLFVAGVMNLLWVATLAGVVLVEKLLPQGRLVGRLMGVGLIGWGIAVGLA